MSKLVVAVAISLVVILPGCGDDKPSDKLASETVRKVAENDCSTGLEVADFTRDNGWVDTETPNRYKVQYKYNLRLKKPYAEAVLAGAKEMQKEMAADSKKASSNLFDINAMQNGLQTMQLAMAANKWIQDQGDGFAKRRDSFVGACGSCVEYWNSKDAPDEAKIRRQTFIASWAYLENYGFKDEAKIGDGVPRSAWAAFTKTENGWQPVQ